MSDSTENLPRYMQVLHDCITREFPDAQIIAPLQVRGKPGAVGVMVSNPVLEPGQDAAENEQHVSSAFEFSDLSDESKVRDRAGLIMACLRPETRTVSLFRAVGAARRAVSDSKTAE